MGQKRVIKNSIFAIILAFSGFGLAIYSQTTEIETLKKQLEQIPENKERVDILVELADKTRSFNFQQAIRYTKDAVKLSEDLDYEKGKMDALRIAGIAQIQHRQERKGIENLISVIPYYETGNDPILESLYQALVNIARQTDDHSLAEIYLEKLENLRYKQITKEALDRISMMKRRLDDQDMAIEEQKEIADELHRDLEIARLSKESAELSLERAELYQENLEQELALEKAAKRTFWLVGGVVFLLLFSFAIWLRYRNRLARQEATALKELNEIKSKLYTYVTHEFRTPLTIISGISDQIQEQPEKWFEKGTGIIKRNANILLRLINHMLDLRKAESGLLKPNYVQSDIMEYLRYLIESFHSLAESKDIKIHLLGEQNAINMDYDPEMVNKIVSNLVSNALKFTPEGGDVYLQADILNENGQEQFLLKVRDTGIGISEEQLPKIFDQFYQVTGKQTREGEGTGIGLALTRELVKLVNGHIEASSKPGEGTVFALYLPVTNEAPVSSRKFEEPEPGLSMNIPEAQEAEVTSSPVREDAATVLIIEDNADVIEFVKACLAHQYKIDVARDGEEGIIKAIESVPDMIISDVMMPKKDGFEVCETLKNDDRTSHIPIIILTAKADFESRLEGLYRGADVYLAKPFNKKELLIRISKLLEVRRKLQARYQNMQPLTASDDPAVEKEDEFIGSLKKLIEENISDENFGILQICRKLGVSRTQLHNKLKALTSLSTSIFIQNVRLLKAKELLETTDLNISQVAYEVGFRHPNYFSRLFSKEFGYPPSRTRN